jgi:hypothetical protein
MSSIDQDYIRLSQDFYLDKSDIGKMISVIINYSYHNKPKKYKNCLLLGLSHKDGLRPSGMTIFWNGKVENIAIYKIIDIQVKYLS